MTLWANESSNFLLPVLIERALLGNFPDRPAAAAAHTYLQMRQLSCWTKKSVDRANDRRFGGEETGNDAARDPCDCRSVT